MTYTLTINNIGSANADNVKVVDTVPAGLTGVTATGDDSVMETHSFAPR